MNVDATLNTNTASKSRELTRDIGEHSRAPDHAQVGR